MKQVIKGEELKTKMTEAINLLCDTVKSTLGPKGNNVIINSTSLSPFITNDGVTIAEAIESDDKVINTILTIAKEASIKTNESVKDGTTTTLVLLQNMFNHGLDLIKSGYNPITLKKEMNAMVDSILKRLDDLSFKATDEDYQKIACISANDYDIGTRISDMYLRVRQNGAIKISESTNSITKSELVNGYLIDNDLASEYFLQGKDELVLNNGYILLIRDELNDLEQIADILNECQQSKKALLIMAYEFSEDVINTVITQNYQQKLNAYLLRVPEYANKRNAILEDLAIFTNGHIIDFNLNDKVDSSKLGKATEIRISKERSLIINKLEDETELKKHTARLTALIKKENDPFEIEFLMDRLAKLKNGIGFIYVGAPTKTEQRELKMRYDDALGAIESAHYGILPGEGLTLLKLQSELQCANDGEKVILESLNKPFRQIMENMGLKSEAIEKVLKEKEYKMVFNPITNEFEEIKGTSIIDPLEVVKNALINASSIASMLLSTSYLVINDFETTSLSREIDQIL